MRRLSIMAFASFLVLWGVYSYLRENAEPNLVSTQSKPGKRHASNDVDSPANQQKRRDLDKIGNVINEDNVDIDHETKEEIKVAKTVYDSAQDLSEKQTMLEQGYMDRASSIKDIKRLQNKIAEIKNKTKADLSNTEKWDPKFVYYLMLQENYTYQEINSIKSLGENGLNPEELNYITELIKEANFMERITSFKNQGDMGRAVASIKKKPKEKDDFIDSPDVGESRESKIIEMDYNHEDKQDMVYENN